MSRLDDETRLTARQVSHPAPTATPLSVATKIVVFTERLSYSVCKGIVELDRELSNPSWLILLHVPRRSLASIAKSQWRNVKRNGWRWVPYQTTELLGRMVSHDEPAATGLGAGYSPASLKARPNVQVVKCEDLHSPDVLETVRRFAPDLGVSLAAPILRRPLFSIPKLGTLNLHKGKVPDYRGMPPAFWELWNSEQTIGCTVHWVDDGLDSGGVVAAVDIKRAALSTLRGLQLQLDEVGVELMCNAVRDVLSGVANAAPQPNGGRTYRKPTLRQQSELRRKLSSPIGEPSTKERLKNFAGNVSFPLWRFGARHVLAPRITVLLYHRVSDEVRDNLTVGIEQFDQQMRFVRCHCEPVSIENVIACTSVPASRKPLVCVTFDDGYLDNYQFAAPILLRNQVPAAFFVSTRIVGSLNRFPHDVRRGNPPIPVMGWDNLRTMRRDGFTIGSHSMTHIDCAAEPRETVQAELVGSMADLRKELGLTEVLFAYPYGGREHMTPARLVLVKDAGYSACLSAYGGTNVGRVDRFNVLRRGIHAGFSPGAFALECLGLR
jgi:peptidoglycan/xylan/chitin deacetylase (PgdA/CDA1 family)/folate-dependent phosphoribosylglycinamide formyltransferase PurN